jgi:hypothetical protein
MKIHNFIALFILCLIASPVNAHKMKSAYTIVLKNERTGFLEVMHRFSLHDAEEAASDMFKGNADIIDDEQTQEKFARYVVSKFKVTDKNDETVSFDLIGFQNDAGYFWVYQDVKWHDDLSHLAINQLVLREVWAEQINIVNVEFSGKTSTLTFSGSDGYQSVALIK